MGQYAGADMERKLGPSFGSPGIMGGCGPAAGCPGLACALVEI